MAHIGLMCPTASGHLNPMTTLGYELHQRGHRVTLVGTPDAQTKTEAAGLEFLAIGTSKFPPGSMKKSLSALGELSGSEALRFTVELFRRVTSVVLEEAPGVIQQAGIELLLIDQTSFGASSVAQRLGLPFISVCCALMINREANVPPINVPWKYAPTWWARLRNQAGYKLIDRLAKPIVDIQADYRQQWNLPVLESANLAFSPLAQLSQQPPEFEYPRESLPDCFHFTGPYSNEASREPAAFPFEKLTGQPLIYTSLGTIQNRVLDTFKTIAQACEGLDAQVVIALGGGSPPEALPPLPGNPIVVGFAPQLALLKKATLTITHAGMNTVLESLSNGVPMVAIPITNDQPGVAARVAWSGTGEVVSLKGLKVTDLRAAITKVLTQESYKQNALKLQTAIQAAGGVKKAADIVETVLKTGKPVLRS